jgi:hypothetical protein
LLGGLSNSEKIAFDEATDILEQHAVGENRMTDHEFSGDFVEFLKLRKPSLASILRDRWTIHGLLYGTGFAEQPDIRPMAGDSCRTSSARVSWLAQCLRNHRSCGSTGCDERKILKGPHLGCCKIGTAEWKGVKRWLNPGPP